MLLNILMFKKLSVVLFFFVNQSAFAEGGGVLFNLVSDTQWSKLMHFNRIEQSSFYLTKNRSSLPLVELQANVREFKENANYSCLFPARAQFLSSKLDLSYKKCTAVEEWKKNVSGNTLSLVFVSQYVSNPASAFGHTFLLLRKKELPLNLSSVISNAANMPEDVSDFDYIYKGLTGGFPAEYNEDRFYLKIQEYNNIENRDMWIYDLNFSEDQIDQLLNHIWELSNRASQNYFFLRQNCAVNIYNTLAAIHPDLEFISEHNLYVLPSETVAKISLITNHIEYQPSIREKIVLRSKNLNSIEAKELENIISTNEFADHTKSIEVAELVLENYEFLKSKQNGILTSPQNANYQNTLLHRSQMGIKPKELDIPAPSPPHKSLPPMRVSAFGGNLDSNSFSGISAAPFYHSLLERSAGYLPFSEFIFLNAEARKISDRNQFDLTLIQMANFPPISVVDSQWSWKVRAGFASQESCEQCWGFDGEFNIGKSIEPHRRNLLFALVGANQDRKTSLSPQVSLGGLSEIYSVNLIYQIRGLQDLSNSRTRTLFDFGFNIPIGPKSNLELLTKLEDKKTDFEASIDFHF